MLFVVILLIGSGWSFLKPFLNDKEKKIVFFVLILQVIDNLALVIVADEEKGVRRRASRSNTHRVNHCVEAKRAVIALLLTLFFQQSTSRSNLENFLHFVDIVCCCLILFPIVGQVRALESTLQSKATERTIEKLMLFRQFYVMVIVYVYFTRILVFLVATLLTFKHAWLSSFFNEGGTLVFYTTVGYKFRPKKQNPYLELRQLDDSDDDDDESLDSELGSRGSVGKKRTLSLEEFGLDEDDENDKL